MRIRRKLIRELADGLLSKSGTVKPPVPVDKLVALAGGEIRRSPTTDDLSGFILRGETGKPVIGVNKSHHLNRQRFTLAHELGHLLLHKGTALHVDHGILRVNLRDKESSKGVDLEEREANAFAAEILMPARFLQHDLDDLDVQNEEQLKKLAKKYGVSEQALVFRLTGLGYIRGS